MYHLPMLSRLLLSLLVLSLTACAHTRVNETSLSRAPRENVSIPRQDEDKPSGENQTTSSELNPSAPRSIETAAQQFLMEYRAPDEIEEDWKAWINRGGSEVWDRPGLTRAQRSIATISIMSVLRDEHTLRVHIESGLANGLTRLEISEVIMHTAVYAGVPQALRSMRIARGVFARLDGASSQ
jgi:alkylhydroperoxidase/carboxymuconolactone decarboxylase family protein YurZ